MKADATIPIAIPPIVPANIQLIATNVIKSKIASRIRSWENFQKIIMKLKAVEMPAMRMNKSFTQDFL